MDFLKLLERIRIPALNAAMSVLTYLGDEIFLMALALIMYWCVSKRRGCYILVAGFFTTAAGQALKMMFRIPRPWVRDPDFTIVESAREGAGGYSFPSGHTQNITAILSATAFTSKRRSVKILAVIGICTVAFSRMYLGVHTPLDVCVGMVISLAITLVLFPFFRDDETFRARIPYVLIAACLAGGAFIAFTSAFPFPADTDAEKISEALRNGCKLFGALIGFTVAYFIDAKYIRFETSASPIAQVLKASLGFVAVVALKGLIKLLFIRVMGDLMFADALRYALVTLFAGAVWPLTFKYFARIGNASDK